MFVHRTGGDETTFISTHHITESSHLLTKNTVYKNFNKTKNSVYK